VSTIIFYVWLLVIEYWNLFGDCILIIGYFIGLDFLNMKTKNVIIGVTASVACYKALDVISGIRRLGIQVTAVLTKEVEEFIKPILFQVVSGNKVITHNMFNMPEEWDSGHVSLAQKADCIAIIPATANIIGKIANGICDDMLTCAVCATKAPVLLAPAMNETMYNNKLVQENIQKLKNAGYHFTGPVKGMLACGKKGMGHIQDPQTIIKEVKSLLGL
jgi:phosphopantothenoylcysteine decarboxylase/phosphopantothenate--cysteine ligase